MHSAILLRDLSVSFSHKVCFSHFSTEIFAGQRIGILGRNGSGKSTLLGLLRDIIEPSIQVGYVPQIVEEYETLSGGERFNKALSSALGERPDVLLLDEPTNHLDRSKRKSLMRMLRGYQGTLIVVSHDVELLRHNVDTLWHIDNGAITVFTGDYDDYLREMNHKRSAIEHEIADLQRQKKEVHQSLMHEQKRAKSSRIKGEKSIEQRKWPAIVSAAKARRAEETSGRKRSNIGDKREELVDKLSAIRLPEVIKPQFSLSPADVDGRLVVYVRDGAVGYEQPILTGLNFEVSGGDKVVITGDNGSGKSTLIRAILDDSQIKKTGTWQVICRSDIGYLDQHYATLDVGKTVLQSIADLVPHWSIAELRKHLNDFLFRKNEEVNALVSTLSGGERARLVLAQIAAKPPRLLILDEMTNNLDLETREHVIEVLSHYPGAMIVISHDDDFIQRLNLTTLVHCETQQS